MKIRIASILTASVLLTSCTYLQKRNDEYNYNAPSKGELEYPISNQDYRETRNGGLIDKDDLSWSLYDDKKNSLNNTKQESNALDKALFDSSNSSNLLFDKAVSALSAMPITTKDEKSGVIATDWYTSEADPTLRTKVNVQTLGSALTQDNLKVDVYKQRKTGNTWKMVSSKGISEKITALILK